MRLSLQGRRLFALLLRAGTAGLLVGAVVLFWQTSRPLRRQVTAIDPGSSNCRSCHEEIYRAWSASHHAHAHRVPDPLQDGRAFQAGRATISGIEYQFGWSAQTPTIEERRPGSAPVIYRPEFVLGHTPLRQFIIPVGNGRYQASEIALHPATQSWFNVFGNEQRQPGEWGHWLGRGMNWNSMCAHCHLTSFQKNYDPAKDSYDSRWLEHGVGCVQCHEPLSRDHASAGYRTPPELRQRTLDRTRNQQTCAPCHARNELLTGEPRPGLVYDDHFRITLPTEAASFYQDGQVRDEDFNWTSLLTSRMGGKAGVTCLDCHEPHSGKTRLDARNNALCMQCHAGGHPTKAPVIDPVAHSHHQPDSAGNRCIECHMPTTTYMQRDPRHDHGFLKPDPLLTKELGIPNACDRCHADKGIDWQIAANERWYGARLESRQRARARVVDAAQKGSVAAPAGLAAMLVDEDIPAWRATLLQLARPWASDPAIASAARAALQESSPLVRSAAVQVLAQVPTAGDDLRAALRDPSRLVRLDAAWALGPDLPADAPQRAELEAYLAVAADQPVGRMRQGQYLANRGRTDEALVALRQATEWDPRSAGLHESLALVLNQAGKLDEAAAAMGKAAQLDPTSGPLAFSAGLAFAAAGKPSEAETALRDAVRREPTLDRAWYNLGLLLAQSGRLAEAIVAIERAEAVRPQVADYPYARATLLWRQGNRPAALDAARRALIADPNHEPARALLNEQR